MKFRFNGLILILIGFMASWFLGEFLRGANAQNQQRSWPGPTGVPASGSPQMDSKALLAGSGTVGITRPLEVPPIYAFESPFSENCRQVVIVDSETKRICVYHIRPQGNASVIEMVAARNFQWDLQLDDFNNEGIPPGQIREQVHRRESGKP